ncbi:MAG TPA: glycoside hydrolase family 3 N-terminal domain-containing protein, partial [Cyclobacteriaceae bacterium]
MQKKVWFGFILFFTLISPLFGQTRKTHWVDSIFQTLDLSGKIGQTLILSIESSSKEQVDRQVNQIKKYNIGGVIFATGSPHAQIHFTNLLQQETKIPVLIGMKAASGLGLDSTIQFPSPQMQGALRDDSLLYFLGSEIGRQLNQMGVHFNMAPAVNLNQSDSSYGENQDRVVSKIVSYQHGLQARNVLSVPVYAQSSDSSLPLQQALKNNAGGLVIDYGSDFKLPTDKKLLTSKLNAVSSALVSGLSPASIRNEAAFNGVVICSVPEIRNLNKKLKAGDAEVFVVKAGNDMLLSPENPGAAIRRLRRALKKDKMLQQQLDASVKKILALKYDAGLYQKKSLNIESIHSRLNTAASLALQKTLYEKSVIVLKDDRQYLPIGQLDNVSFASLSIGGPKESTLTSFLSKYVPFNHFKFQVTEDTVGLGKNLLKHEWVIVAIYPTTPGLEKMYPELLEKVGSKSKVIVVNMGPYSNLTLVEKMPAVIQAHNNHEIIQRFIPQLIFGAKKADSQVPIFINDQIKIGQGLQTNGLNRISHSIAEQEGLDSQTLKKIATIAQEAIDQKAAPGCQVLITRHGKLIYEQSFGSQTYENKIPVTDQTIYDLASVSKVMGTLQAVM